MLRHRRAPVHPTRQDSTAETSEATRKAAKPSAPWLSWTLFAAALVLVTWFWVFHVPTSSREDTDSRQFSEVRALRHVYRLSDEIGFRQVSSPGLKEATTYLRRECEKLAALANAQGSLHAEVDLEVVSGAVVDKIFGRNLINIYRNLTNLILFVAPKDALGKPAVLINAHYDSALGSPGAADCASCVGVGLEVVRAMIQGDVPLRLPVLLLLNGGEETLLQAAHGFMQQSRWRSRLGAFINIESTGSGGLPVLFQYTGGWTLRAYGSAAPIPRACVLGQEFFETGLIPADTDYRMFSSQHHGTLPGVDIATILDAAAYHTNRDTYARLKSGTTQELGMSVLALARRMMEMMEGGEDEGEHEKVVYTDLFHLHFLLYSITTAQWLHAAPLVVGIGSFLLAKKRRAFVRSVLQGMVETVISSLFCVSVPLLLGTVRVLLSGRPMTWVSHHVAAFVLFWPGALFGFLLPLSYGLSQADVAARFAAIGFLAGLVAWVLAFLNIGSSFLPFWIALSTSLSSLLTSLSSSLPFEALLALALGAASWSSSNLLVMIRHVMEKIGMASASAAADWIPDAVIGGLNGALALGVLLPVAPLLTVRWKRHSKSKLLWSLFVGCCAVGAVTSGLFPYSVDRPKRVMLFHVCKQQSEGGGCDSVWTAAASDVIPVQSCLPEAISEQDILPSGPLDWASLAPFSALFKGVSFPAPDVQRQGPWGTSHPELRVVDDVTGGRTRRLEFELRWEKPGWGAMRMTGPILNWSLSDPVGIRGERNMVRFAQDGVDPVWPFWIEIESGATLDMELGILYPTPSETTTAMAAQFPEWTAVATGTSFVSRHAFSTDK